METSGMSWVLTSGNRGILVTAIQSVEANTAAGHSTVWLPPFFFFFLVQNVICFEVGKDLC